MGVMNVVTQGYVTCCKRQLGCISFFENTKIIKKVESLLLNRNRSARRARSPSLCLSPTAVCLPTSLCRSIIRLRTLSLLAQLREASTDAAKNVGKTLFQKVLREDLLSDDVLSRMATFELFKTMGSEYAFPRSRCSE
jgi:hypothetical protein